MSLGNLIIIKYISNIEDLKENEYYSLKFDYSKCMQIIEPMGITYKSKKEQESFVENLNKQEIVMKFVGYSRVDGLQLFVLDEKQTKRDQKIDSILK